MHGLSMIEVFVVGVIAMRRDHYSYHGQNIVLSWDVEYLTGNAHDKRRILCYASSLLAD